MGAEPEDKRIAAPGTLPASVYKREVSKTRFAIREFLIRRLEVESASIARWQVLRCPPILSCGHSYRMYLIL